MKWINAKPISKCTYVSVCSCIVKIYYLIFNIINLLCAFIIVTINIIFTITVDQNYAVQDQQWLRRRIGWKVSIASGKLWIFVTSQDGGTLCHVNWQVISHVICHVRNLAVKTRTSTVMWTSSVNCQLIYYAFVMCAIWWRIFLFSSHRKAYQISFRSIWSNFFFTSHEASDFSVLFTTTS